MSALFDSRSSIISTSTSITRTARMRTTKVLARYQVSVREGKKSNSMIVVVLARDDDAVRPVAPPPQALQPLGQFRIAGLQRADRLSAGHVGDAVRSEEHTSEL